MRLGAIVIVRTQSEESSSTALAGTDDGRVNLCPEPLPCAEVVGRSGLEMVVERFLHAGVDVISVLAQAGSYRIPAFRATREEVTVQIVNDLNSAVTQKLNEFSQSGIEHAFVNSADAYAETDLLDLFYFHRAAGQAITRVFDREGPLALAVVDCAQADSVQAQLFPIDTSSQETTCNGSSYFVREYAIRLSHPRALRQLSVDILKGRSERRPCGREVRPGVWLDERAEIHRRARIVAPAFIGCGSNVLEDTLITRFSSIERNCYIDCGTVIEDSSILANTHIGIWLDVCHALVQGNRVFSLERDVAVQISDPKIMHAIASVRRESVRASEGDPRRVTPAAHREPSPALAIWQLGTTFIQE